ncbi:MAG: RNA polymerase subunit sigma [Deltaproteobacteria bacterium]|nr:MAG: RNA polymerase subunit sigma [Deltaproteobacteria bacterium]
MTSKSDFAKAAEALKRGRVSALTGAGISTESGIPDFRSRGGLWDRFAPEEYATVEAFYRDPAKVWKMLEAMERLLSSANPNKAHKALATLEEEKLLDGIITQNVDMLHQAAGSRMVVEFHGSSRSYSCLWCDLRYSREEASRRGNPPLCSCGKHLKPDVVFFGEGIPPEAMAMANQLAKGCRAMLVIGTSAEVYPANQMPHIARRAGATIIEVNLEPTQLTGSITDIFLRGNASEVLEELLEAVS